MDAQFYFKNGLPYDRGRLMDLLGVDLLLLTKDSMPSRYEKIYQEGVWSLWRNPTSLGSHFCFFGTPQQAARKDIFQSFADGKADPLQNLYMDPVPLSLAPRHLPSDEMKEDADFIPLPADKTGYLVATQNAMPGWRAWVDGKPSPIYLADGIFQCVPFSSGSRNLLLRYEPASFRLGLFLSLLTLAGYIGWLGKKRHFA